MNLLFNWGNINFTSDNGKSAGNTHIRDSDKLLGYLIKTETREFS